MYSPRASHDPNTSPAAGGGACRLKEERSRKSWPLSLAPVQPIKLEYQDHFVSRFPVSRNSVKGVCILEITRHNLFQHGEKGCHAFGFLNNSDLSVYVSGLTSRESSSSSPDFVALAMNVRHTGRLQPLGESVSEQKEQES